MSRSNTSSWFPIAMFLKTPEEKTASKNILFGPAKQTEYLSYPYPDETVVKDETVIWMPKLHKTISLKSYERAHLEHDNKTLGEFTKMGLPLGCTFGGTLKWPTVKKNTVLASKVNDLVSKL